MDLNFWSGLVTAVGTLVLAVVTVWVTLHGEKVRREDVKHARVSYMESLAQQVHLRLTGEYGGASVVVTWPVEYKPRFFEGLALREAAAGSTSFGVSGSRENPNTYVQKYDAEVFQHFPSFIMGWVDVDDQRWVSLDGELTCRRLPHESLHNAATRLDNRLHTGGREDI